MYCMESFYEKQNVTNCMMINEDEMLISLQNKMVIYNLDTQMEKVVLESDSGQAFFIDMCMIPQNPGSNPYFILHTGRGIQLVNAAIGRCYDLVLDEQEFNMNKTLSVVPVDASDLDQGFWLCQINVTKETGKQVVKAFDFETEFMQGLK